MAASPIKYKLKDAQPKLLPGAHVEVRSLEEGFEGSWHAATVVGARGESSLRRVRYDHLLVDDGSEILVEWIKVSCMLDGFFPGDGVPVNYRGIMRPVPPPEFRVDCWGLHYGLCVDACVSDAWWEGVVFDHGDGLDQRLVFFPDLGDQQMVKIENLRVTHDWGETSAAWTKRGDWLFLDLIQEYDEVCAGVSVRQLWYDVRAKEGFRTSVKEWTCPRRGMWVDLVVEVIRDNMDLRAEFLLSVVIESQNAVNFVRGPSILPCEDQLPVASPDPTTRARSRSATKSYSEDNLHDRIEEDHVASAPSQRTRSKLRNTSAPTVHCEGIRQHHSEENQLALTWPGSCKTTKNTSSGNTSDCEEVLQYQIEEEKQLVLTSPGFDVNPTSTSVHSDPSLSTDVSAVTGIRGYHGDDMSKVQDGRFVQDPIDKFLHMERLGRKPNYKRTQEEVRMHLSDLGWKIEHIAYNRPVYHYVSPEGRTFNSLIKVCEFLRPSKDNITAQRSQNVDKNLVDSSIASLRSSVQQVPSPQQCFSEGHGGTPPGEQGNRSSSVKNIRVSKIKEAVEVEPEFCPGALLELCGLEARPVGKNNLATLRLKAKKHLAAMGWTFWYVRKYEGRELRYASPYNKVYNSLHTACQGYLKEGLSKSTMPMHESTIGEKSIGHKLHGNLSSATVCAEADKFPMSVNGKSDHVETRELSQSRELEFGNMKVKRVKGPRKRKRDNSLPFKSRLKATFSDTIQDSLSPDILCSKTQGDTLDQNPSSQEKKKRKKVRTLTRKGDHLDGSSRSRLPRSNKRARQVVASHPAHFFPRTVLSWLVDNNVILPREKVYYLKKNQSCPLAEGKITRDGIKCSCCQKVYGLTSFEAHAGSTYHRPAEHIFLEDGRSLLDCQKQMILDGKTVDYRPEPSQKIKSNLQNNKNDIICSVCHYGGILVLCDHCPASFHLSCIGLEEVPDGKWFCPSCRCGLCGQGEFNGNIKQFTDETILYCDQCEREYHVGCVRKQRAVKLDSCPKESWFCSEKCEKIFMNLHTLLGKSIPLGVDSLSWSILKFSKAGYESDACNTLTMAELHSKLNVALSVMHECFEPIKEPQTKDLVKDVLFNRSSNLKRLDFRGFYTVLLEKEDELISVATIRVYGGKVAEVPLIGTRVQYRRKGMCRMLMNLLEKKLAEFGVERLLLPAIPQVLHAWTTSFGFSKMTNSERLEFVEYTFLDFQDTTMCQKKLMSGPTEKFVGPEDQYGVQDDLNLSNMDAAFDGGNVDSKVTRRDEQSDIMKQISLGVPACNDCSTTEAGFPLTTTSTEMLWSKYENYSKEVAEKQKEDEGGEQTEYFRYYKRRKYSSQAKLCL